MAALAPLLAGAVALAGCAGETDAPAAESTLTKPNPLAFTTGLLADTSACRAAKRDDCADDDQDGLTDAWEDALLRRFAPVVELDEQEDGLQDPRFRLGTAGRVVARPDDPTLVLAFFALAFSEDYGQCSFTEHHGDVERAVVEVKRDAVPGGHANVVRIFVGSHEGDFTDASRSYEGASLESELEFVERGGVSRWLVYAARNKHGIYVNKEVCEDRWVPCIADYCGADIDDRESLRRSPLLLNAGEPSHPRDDDWTAFGYPGSSAYSDQPFCGGATSGDCDAAPRAALTKDPFSGKTL